MLISFLNLYNLKYDLSSYRALWVIFKPPQGRPHVTLARKFKYLEKLEIPPPLLPSKPKNNSPNNL